MPLSSSGEDQEGEEVPLEEKLKLLSDSWEDMLRLDMVRAARLLIWITTDYSHRNTFKQDRNERVSRGINGVCRWSALDGPEIGSNRNDPPELSEEELKAIAEAHQRERMLARQRLLEGTELSRWRSKLGMQRVATSNALQQAFALRDRKRRKEGLPLSDSGKEFAREKSLLRDRSMVTPSSWSDRELEHQADHANGSDDEAETEALIRNFLALASSSSMPVDGGNRSDSTASVSSAVGSATPPPPPSQLSVPLRVHAIVAAADRMRERERSNSNPTPPQSQSHPSTGGHAHRHVGPIAVPFAEREREKLKEQHARDQRIADAQSPGFTPHSMIHSSNYDKRRLPGWLRNVTLLPETEQLSMAPDSQPGASALENDGREREKEKETEKETEKEKEDKAVVVDDRERKQTGLLRLALRGRDRERDREDSPDIGGVAPLVVSSMLGAGVTNRPYPPTHGSGPSMRPPMMLQPSNSNSPLLIPSQTPSTTNPNPNPSTSTSNASTSNPNNPNNSTGNSNSSNTSWSSQQLSLDLEIGPVREGVTMGGGVRRPIGAFAALSRDHMAMWEGKEASGLPLVPSALGEGSQSWVRGAAMQGGTSLSHYELLSQAWGQKGRHHPHHRHPSNSSNSNNSNSADTTTGGGGGGDKTTMMPYGSETLPTVWEVSSVNLNKSPYPRDGQL
jgi:hypothetical protein